MTQDVKCPICGSETVIRTATKGPNTGRKFHVCIRFPQCKGKIPVEKSAATRVKEKLTCQNCGAAISQSDKFCVHCGEKFTRQEPETTLSVGLKETKNGKGRIPAIAKNDERRREMAFKCPYCGQEGPPSIKKSVSSTGWIIFVLLLLFCLPLCWLPFVVKGFKEEERRCRACGTKLG